MPDLNDPKVEPMTAEEINSKIETDPAFADQVAEGNIPEIKEAPATAGADPAVLDPDKTIEPNPEPAAADPATPGASPTPGEEDEIVQVPIKKSLLGKYKTPEAFLKSKEHADRHISYLETKLDQLQEQLQEQGITRTKYEKLVQEFTTLQKQIKTAKAPPPATPGVPAADDFVKEEDGTISLLHDENQKRVLSAVKSLPQEVAELRSLVTKLQQENGQILEAGKKENEKAQRGLAVKAEFVEYGTFAKSNPEFALSKSIEEVDAEVSKFRSKIMGLASEGAANEQDALAVFNAYFNDSGEKGDKIRKKAEAAGIVPTEDHENYNKLMALRQFRRKKSNPADPMSLDEAYLLFNKDGISKAMLSARVEGAGAVIKAITKAGDTPKQLPVGGGGGDKANTANMTAREKDQILNLSDRELAANPDKRRIHDQLIEELTKT